MTTEPNISNKLLAVGLKKAAYRLEEQNDPT